MQGRKPGESATNEWQRHLKTRHLQPLNRFYDGPCQDTRAGRVANRPEARAAIGRGKLGLVATAMGGSEPSHAFRRAFGVGVFATLAVCPSLITMRDYARGRGAAWLTPCGRGGMRVDLDRGR